MRIIRIYSSHTVTNFVIRYIRKIRMTINSNILFLYIFACGLCGLYGFFHLTQNLLVLLSPTEPTNE